MEVKIYLGSKNKRSFKDYFRRYNNTEEKNGFSLNLDEQGLISLVKEVSGQRGMRNSDILYGSLFGSFPIGIEVKGNFNPMDIYSIVTERGYPILKSSIDPTKF